jgi:spore coat polysaccharide biosynthesis protein SpsF (cytidylyltransferase family)
MKTGSLILQARMGSERLPGKSMLGLAGQPMIDALMQRLDAINCEKWLATSDSDEDDVLSIFAKKHGWQVLRGSKEDVLSRFEQILTRGDSTYCLRVTGDNPLVCPTGLTEMIRKFDDLCQEIDYMSDFDFGEYPVGAFAEIFSVPKFLSGVKDIPADEPWHFAHVTSWMRKSTRISPLQLPSIFVPRTSWRWTIDYPEDLEFISQLIKCMGRSWISSTYPEIVRVLDSKPQLLAINFSLKQKPIELG